MNAFWLKSFRFRILLWLSILLPPAALGQTPPGLSIQTYAGLTITGATGVVYAIESTFDPSQSNGWACVAFVRPPSTNYLWVDSTGPATSNRFYRALAVAPTNLVFADAGRFTIGSPSTEVGHQPMESPQTMVVLTKGFFIGKYPVTQGEYLDVVGVNPSYFNTNHGYPLDLTRPVEQVSWNNATNFCALRTQRELAAGIIPPGTQYRLPTEAEWEYVCRAGSSTRFFYGEDPNYMLYSVLAEGFNRAYAQTLQADGSEHEIKLTRFQPVMDNIQVTGTAVDADTGLPLDTFKVFMSELDSDWAFPPQFYTEAADGKFNVSFKAKSSHPGYRIQIEKEGYLPAVSADLLKKAGNLTLEFQLHKGSGPSGVVLQPSGEPANDATVLLCTSVAGVTIDGPAHVQKGLNTTTYQTQTDATGKFSLAPAVDPQGLIIIHEAGYAEVSLPALAGGGSFTLQPWGRVTGKVILDSRPAANQHVTAYNYVARYSDTGRRFCLFTFHLEATTDADGKFSFDKVPPGRCKVFRQELRSLAGFESHDTSVEVKSGTQSEVVLGGTGRTLIGKVVLPRADIAVDWQTVPVRLRLKTGDDPGLRPKRADFSSTEAFIKAQDHFFAAYDAQKRFGAFCDNDGSFRVPDVPAGTYELQIKVRDSKSNSVVPHAAPDPMTEIGSVVREVIVPETPEADPIDLGIVELMPQQENASTR